VVAIPFEVGQVSTKQGGRKMMETAKQMVAIPFEVGQVSTYKQKR